jgi:hypothetical protein
VLNKKSERGKTRRQRTKHCIECVHYCRCLSTRTSECAARRINWHRVAEQRRATEVGRRMMLARRRLIATRRRRRIVQQLIVVVVLIDAFDVFDRHLVVDHKKSKSMFLATNGFSLPLSRRQDIEYVAAIARRSSNRIIDHFEQENE